MKKILISFFSLCLSIIALVGCQSNPSSSQEEFIPQNELQKAFYALKDNNFSIDYYGSYANNDGIQRHQKTYYTSYSLQSEGDYGFFGYAQNDECVFSYNLVDGQVVSSPPIYDYSTGIRYDSIYQYREGMQDFDFSYLDDTKNEDGYYTYKFGENLQNDKIFAGIFFRVTYNPNSLPGKVNISIVKNVITIEAVLLIYDETHYDSCESTIYNINQTENAEIKQYLQDGKTAKTPLNNHFYSFIAPYLMSNSYKVSLDATHLWDTSTQSYYNFKMNQYFTDDAILYEDLTSSGRLQGYAVVSGVITQFFLDSLNDDRIELGMSVQADAYGNFYQALYGDYLLYALSLMSFSNFIGYIDEDNPNVFYFTDSQLKYILSYICYVESDTTYNYINSLKMEILDYENHEFKLTFNFIDTTTGINKGDYIAIFSDLNKTSIPAVERHLKTGDDASSQDIEVLKSVLNKFSKHNYMMDTFVTYTGIAQTYFSSQYKYVVVPGNPNANYGYIKPSEGYIYEFNINYNSNNQPTNINVDESINYALGDNALVLPGCGSYVNASDDLFYISAFDEAIYDYEKYVKDDSLGFTYWRNTTTGLSQKFLDYFGYASNYFPNGSGFMVCDSDDPYDVRVTLIISVISKTTGEYNYLKIPFYNIGGSFVKIINQYLDSLGGN